MRRLLSWGHLNISGGIVPLNLAFDKSSIRNFFINPISDGSLDPVMLTPASFKVTKFEIRIIPEGIEPYMWLVLSISRRLSKLEDHSPGGIDPLSWVDDKSSFSNLSNFSSSSGMVPDTSVARNEKLLKFVSKRIWLGIDPRIAVRGRRNSSSFVNPISDGMTPVISLQPRSSRRSFVSWPIFDGIEPLRELFT